MLNILMQPNDDLKFMFSKKATRIDFTLCSKCQIDGEDFCDLLRKNEL